MPADRSRKKAREIPIGPMTMEKNIRRMSSTSEENGAPKRIHKSNELQFFKIQIFPKLV